MGQTQCPECGREVSTAIVKCPGCGHQLRDAAMGMPARGRTTSTPSVPVQQPVYVKPTFWNSANVGAVALLILVLLFAIGCWIYFATTHI